MAWAGAPAEAPRYYTLPPPGQLEDYGDGPAEDMPDFTLGAVPAVHAVHKGGGWHTLTPTDLAGLVVPGWPPRHQTGLMGGDLPAKLPFPETLKRHAREHRPSPASNATDPNDTEPDDTDPNDTEPDDTEPDDTDPNDTEPDDTGPDDTDPNDANGAPMPSNKPPGDTEDFLCASPNAADPDDVNGAPAHANDPNPDDPDDANGAPTPTNAAPGDTEDFLCASPDDALTPTNAATPTAEDFLADDAPTSAAEDGFSDDDGDSDHPPTPTNAPTPTAEDLLSDGADAEGPARSAPRATAVAGNTARGDEVPATALTTVSEGVERATATASKAQQRSRQATSSSGSVGSGQIGSGQRRRARGAHNTVKFNGRLYQVLTELSTATGLVTVLDYDPYSPDSRAERHIKHTHGIYVPGVGLCQIVTARDGRQLAFTRAGNNEPADVKAFSDKLRKTPNVVRAWAGSGGAIRRVCENAEQHRRVTALLNGRKRALHNSGPEINIPAGHTAVSFETAFLPEAYPFGACPLSGVLATLSGFLSGRPAWWANALDAFFAKHPHIARPAGTDKATWWNQRDMNALCQFLPPYLDGRKLQLTRQGAFVDALDQAGRRHLGLLESREVLLLYVAMGDDFHWILADGARGVWYPLDGKRGVLMPSKKDMGSEQAAAAFFEADLQVDVIKLVYTLSVGAAQKKQGYRKRGGRGKGSKPKKRRVEPT